jgi:hypothetical protein
MCPQCRQEVSARAILFPSALGGVGCPHCHAGLEPDVRSRVLITIVTAATFAALNFGLGENYPIWVRFPTVLGAAFAVSLVLASRVTRLRPKRPAVPSLRQDSRSERGLWT